MDAHPQEKKILRAREQTEDTWMFKSSLWGCFPRSHDFGDIPSASSPSSSSSSSPYLVIIQSRPLLSEAHSWNRKTKTLLLYFTIWHTNAAQRRSWLKFVITIWAHREHFIGTTNSCRFKMTPATSPLPIPLCRGEGLTSSPTVPRADAFREQLGRPTALTL